MLLRAQVLYCAHVEVPLVKVDHSLIPNFDPLCPCCFLRCGIDSFTIMTSSFQEFGLRDFDDRFPELFFKLFNHCVEFKFVKSIIIKTVEPALCTKSQSFIGT